MNLPLSSDHHFVSLFFQEPISNVMAIFLIHLCEKLLCEYLVDDDYSDSLDEFEKQNEMMRRKWTKRMNKSRVFILNYEF